MPIVHFTNRPAEVPADAVNVRAQHSLSSHGSDVWGPRAHWLWDSHVGLCVKEYERNSYHDSDFHMIVWNPETNAPEDICFASTRGWSYPSYASKADATPEVQAAYDAYIAAATRRRRTMEKLARRKLAIEFARAIGETNYRKLRKLEAVVPGGKWAQTKELLMSKRLRSDFRKSLREQILNWYRDPNPRYPTPLSRKQWDYV